jgi:hypothetical protein
MQVLDYSPANAVAQGIYDVISEANFDSVCHGQFALI